MLDRPDEDGDEDVGRKNHRWSTITRETDDSYYVTCRHCALMERNGHFRGANGQIYAVLQWSTPAGLLLGVRPVVQIRGLPKDAPSFDERFGDTPVTSSPECPKDPAAWDVRADVVD